MHVFRTMMFFPVAAALIAVCPARAQGQDQAQNQARGENQAGNQAQNQDQAGNQAQGAELALAGPAQPALTQPASAQPALAQQSAAQTSAAASASPSLVQKPQGFVDSFLARVSATQAEQPHWVTPLVTVTPRLEQELRTDFVYAPQPNHTTEWNFGNGKGLELIPLSKVELIFNIPEYLEHNSPTEKDGFGDVSFLMKYRVFARNEEHGNSIFTIFIGASLPTGSYSNGDANATVTPTLAGGKGFGKFDVQMTVGATLPTAGGSTQGRPIAWNSTVQFHQDAHWWPEIEDNFTHYIGGGHDGMTQNFITPGVVTRYKLHNRIGITLGAGLQLATSGYHGDNHNVVMTARMPF
jgi:hypothetical protein